MAYSLTPPERLDFGQDVPERTVWQENDVSRLFFSGKNIEALQHGIRYGVYRMSNGKHVVGNQSASELRAIMRSVYLTHAVNLPYGIVDQVRALNKHVLDYAVPSVTRAATAYDRYVRDASRPVRVMEPPRSVSIKGDRSLDFLPR